MKHGANVCADELKLRATQFTNSCYKTDPGYFSKTFEFEPSITVIRYRLQRGHNRTIDYIYTDFMFDADWSHVF